MRTVLWRAIIIILSATAVGLISGCENQDQQENLSATPAQSQHEVAHAPARDDLLPVGSKAPTFTATDQQGHRISLNEMLAEGDVVLVFYPGDFTPGCTKQLCAVRDDWSEFRQREATVIGINPADVETHARYVDEYNFPFPIVSDQDSRIASAYGCKGETYTTRTVYVIDESGRIALAERGMVPHDKIFAAVDH